MLLAKPCRFAKSVGQSGTDPALVLSIVLLAHLTDPRKCPNAPAEVRKTAAQAIRERRVNPNGVNEPVLQDC